MCIMGNIYGILSMSWESFCSSAHLCLLEIKYALILDSINVLILLGFAVLLGTGHHRNKSMCVSERSQQEVENCISVTRYRLD